MMLKFAVINMIVFRDAVIGTPGRILDLALGRNLLKLDKVKHIVIDEVQRSIAGMKNVLTEDNSFGDFSTIFFSQSRTCDRTFRWVSKINRLIDWLIGGCRLIDRWIDCLVDVDRLIDWLVDIEQRYNWIISINWLIDRKIFFACALQLNYSLLHLKDPAVEIFTCTSLFPSYVRPFFSAW